MEKAVLQMATCLEITENEGNLIYFLPNVITCLNVVGL